MSIIIESQEAAGKETGLKRDQRLHISLLGTFSLRHGDTSLSLDTASHQALLAYLLLQAGQDQDRHLLAFRFWPDSTESQALTNLRKALYTFRRTLPDADQYLDVDRQTVKWLKDAPCLVDVLAFETAVDRARAVDSPAAKQTLLAEAIDHYHGELLPGHYDDWVLAAREGMRRRYLNALEEMIALLENRRQYRDAIEISRRLLRTDPLHESAYRRLMRLQSLDGDVAGALRTYHACSGHLQQELGVDPGPATREAYERLLQIETPEKPPAPARLPLTGRKNAWQTLLSAWKRGSSGNARFVVISGEAGIGKTRLAEELLEWAARQGITTRSASSYAAGGSLPYAPVTAWLRAMTNDRLLANLPQKWQQEVSRLLPELLLERPGLHAPGPIRESWQRQHLFAALAHAVLSQSQPFILFVDDLQWCDLDTLQWLSYLIHFDQSARFLLVGAVRTEEVAADHPLNDLISELRHEDKIVELELARLNEAETKMLAGHVTGQALDEMQCEELATYSEGVPLFIVEMARAGWPDIARDEPQKAGDNFRQQGLLPAKVRSVIESRLSRLSPPAADLAVLGAAIGRFFTYDLLAAASTQKEAVIVRALDELWQQRIVREQGADAYDFSHDQLRQVAYASLSSAKRRWLHGRIVTALEAERASGGEVDNAQLGEHYAAAGQPDAAAASFRRAAVDAQQLFAHKEALANLQRALALSVEDKHLLLRLREQLADVQAMVGQYDEARESLAAALVHASDSIDRARLLRKQGNAWISQRLHDKAGEAYDIALDVLERAPDQRESSGWWAEWFELQVKRGELLYFTAQLPALAELINELHVSVDDQGLARMEPAFLNLQIMFNIASKRWRLDEGDVARSKRLLALARQTGSEHEIAFIRFSLGFMYLFSGSAVQAETELKGALQQATECGNLPLQDQCLAYLMLAHRRQGQEDQVRELVERHRPISDQVMNLNYRGVLFGCDAWLSYRSGDTRATVRHAEKALDLWNASVYPLWWVALWPLLAVALEQGRTADAVECAARMLKPPAQRLADDVTAELQGAVDAWEAGETAVCVDHLSAALHLAQTTNTF